MSLMIRNEPLTLDTVRRHVTRFLEANPKWVQIDSDPASRGMGLCDSASEELVVYLLQLGIQARPLWLDERNYSQIKTHKHYPDGVGHVNNEHCVVLIDEVFVVDLTPRQFSENLPFPYLWKVS